MDATAAASTAVAPAAAGAAAAAANPMLEAVRAYRLDTEDLLLNADLAWWKTVRMAVAQRIAGAMRLSGLEAGAALLTQSAEHPEEHTNNCYVRQFVCHPVVWLRAFVAVSLMDDPGYRRIKDFGNGHIWDIGCGSGYHAWMLRSRGAQVLASDVPENEFLVRYAPTRDARPTEEEIGEIARNGGAALYFWPSREYHELDLWVRLGGRRVITVGCFGLADHCWLADHPGVSPEDAPPVCPAFPPPHLEARFRRVLTHSPPHFSKTDRSVRDTAEFYEIF